MLTYHCQNSSVLGCHEHKNRIRYRFGNFTAEMIVFFKRSLSNRFSKSARRIKYFSLSKQIDTNCDVRPVTKSSTAETNKIIKSIFSFLPPSLPDVEATEIQAKPRSECRAASHPTRQDGTGGPRAFRWQHPSTLKSRCQLDISCTVGTYMKRGLWAVDFVLQCTPWHLLMIKAGHVCFSIIIDIYLYSNICMQGVCASQYESMFARMCLAFKCMYFRLLSVNTVHKKVHIQLHVRLCVYGCV